MIALIRRSRDGRSARTGLMELLSITEKQAQAILEITLQRLTQMEISKVEEEHRELLEQIAYLRRILNEEALVMSIIGDELKAIKKKHADERRTQITVDEGDIDITDLIFQEDVVTP